ncbi:hypothetical protein ACLB2K_069235 [Fragaria x ananassa]
MLPSIADSHISPTPIMANRRQSTMIQAKRSRPTEDAQAGGISCSCRLSLMLIPEAEPEQQNTEQKEGDHMSTPTHPTPPLSSPPKSRISDHHLSPWLPSNYPP